jgi:hypothetical protein
MGVSAETGQISKVVYFERPENVAKRDSFSLRRLSYEAVVNLIHGMDGGNGEPARINEPDTPFPGGESHGTPRDIPEGYLGNVVLNAA